MKLYNENNKVTNFEVIKVQMKNIDQRVIKATKSHDVKVRDACLKNVTKTTWVIINPVEERIDLKPFH